MYNCSTLYVPFYGAISVEWVLGSLWSWQDGADKNSADNCGEEHYDKDDEVSLNKNVYIDFFLSLVCIIYISVHLLSNSLFLQNMNILTLSWWKIIFQKLWRSSSSCSKLYKPIENCINLKIHKMLSQHARNKQVSKNIRIQRLYLYNNTRYVAYSRPNGWTEWAETFCGHSEVKGDVLGKKKTFFHLLKNKFQYFPWATPGSSASI